MNIGIYKLGEIMRLKKSNTCIAALKHRNKIYIAADRKASWDWSKAQAMPRAKLSKREGLILAGTGSGALCTLIVDILNIPNIEDIDLDTYMHHKLFEAIRKLLINKGFSDEHKILKIPAELDAQILVAIQGKLYDITISNCDPTNVNPNGLIMIDELNLPYGTGCGGDIAEAALKENEDLFMYDSKKDSYRFLTPYERLERAVTLACQMSPGCGLPIDIIRED